jgi:hypothetical protein
MIDTSIWASPFTVLYVMIQPGPPELVSSGVEIQAADWMD